MDRLCRARGGGKAPSRSRRNRDADRRSVRPCVALQPEADAIFAPVARLDAVALAAAERRPLVAEDQRELATPLVAAQAGVDRREADPRVAGVGVGTVDPAVGLATGRT